MLLQQLFVSAVIVPFISLTFPFLDNGSHDAGINFIEPAAVACSRPSFEGSRVSRTMQLTSHTAVKDFNNDGRLDIANQGNPFQTLSIQFGTGNGYFGEPVMIDPNSAGSLFSADFNNDGNADLLTFSKIYFGDGVGGFSLPRPLNIVSNADSSAIGDFNGDDNIDLALASSSSRNVEIYYGDGEGRFSPATVVDLLSGYVESFTVADLNSDGISDIAADITNLNTVTVIFGSATGVFSAPVNYPVGGTGTAARLTTGDLDGDGDLDIVTSTLDYSNNTQMTVLLNSGSGTFTAQPQFTEPIGTVINLKLADVNSDGPLDLIAESKTGVLVIKHGNNNGTFQQSKRILGLTDQAQTYFEDFTGDGIRDLAVNSTGVSSFAVIVNDGTGNLGPRQIDSAPNSSPSGLASADFNGDGKTDVVTANENLSLRIAFGDGVGSFGSPSVISIPRTPRAVIAADINNDGHKDIFAILQNAPDIAAETWVAMGNGNGTFQPAVTSIVADFRGARMPALVDLNGDGLLDLATPSVSNDRVAILRGWGNGSFIQERVLDTFTRAQSIASGDFNQDGFQDIAVLASSVYVFLGNGGFFPDAIGAFPAGQSNGQIIVADFNSDGILDLAASTDFIGGGIGNPGKVVILLGAGLGGFGPPREYTTGRGSGQLVVADFDGDGNKDLAVANSGYNFTVPTADTRVTVLYGDGQGQFPRIQDSVAAYYPKGIAAIDFDTDGKTDIVTADWGQSRLTLLKNTCLAAPAALPQINAGPDVSINEGDTSDTNVDLTVSLNAPSAISVRVSYRTAPSARVTAVSKGVTGDLQDDLTVKGRKDYLPASGQLVFAPGETSKTVRVTIRGDLIDEFDEYVSVYLFDATNASIGRKQALIKIIDNDPPPTVSIGNVSSPEGNAGITTFSVPVSVSLVSEKPVTIQYSTGGGTATPNQDYLRGPGTFTLPAGQGAGSLPVTAYGDLTYEQDETFFVDIVEVVNATVAGGRATATIINDDIGGSVKFSSPAYSVSENTGALSITITRTGGIAGGVSVRFRTQAGTATPGLDYVETQSTVQFGDNETSKNLEVLVIRDTLDEPDETVNLLLDTPSGVTIGSPSAAVMTIQDPDDPPNLSISDAQLLEGNSGNVTMQFYLRLSRPTQRTVTVNFASANVTATAPSDYDAATGTHTINPGVTRSPINITVRGDTTFEPDETFQVNLTNAVNANLIDAQAVGTIINDEPNPRTTLQFASINQAGTGSANSDSLEPSISADGNVIAFESFASNLGGTDINGFRDIYVRDIGAGITRLASINFAGTSAGGCESRSPRISANGRFVTFISCATNLVPPGSNSGGFDGYAVFVRDLQTNQTRLASVNSAGGTVDAFVWDISADGRFIVFQSNDLGVTSVPDIPNTSDLFVRDTVNHVTHLVSINAAGTATGNASSGNASIARDVKITQNGRYVLFPSTATNLVFVTHGGGSNLYVRDILGQTTSAVAVNTAGTQLVGHDGTSSITDNGRYVFFSSTAATIVAGDSNSAADVFRRDLQTGTTTLVSVRASGSGTGNAESSAASGSADGRYVAFASTASDLSSAPDSNTFPDIYWRDIQTGVTLLSSGNFGGTNGGNSFSSKPYISANGQRILFTSTANDLVAGNGDNNANFDLYLRDLVTNATHIVSANQGGSATGNEPTREGRISANGNRVAFASSSSNLIPNDLNGFGSDVYAFSKNSATSFDFDGDGKTDVSIFRPSVGEWWYSRSSNGTVGSLQLGASTDTMVPTDFTGDGKTDIAVFRPSTGFWYVLRSEDFSFFSFPFGSSGDIPSPSDYDGDGKADAAVFRPAGATWFVLRSGDGGTTIRQFGATGDLPVAADYDGDGKADIAIYRPTGASGAEWWISKSTGGVFATVFGTSTDRAVAGDYTGDGKADIAFWRPSTGQWFILRSEDLSFFAFPFGASGDVPVPGDYDGDGKTDAGVFRPAGSTWFVQRSTAGTLIQQLGQPGDLPTPNAFVR